MSLVAIFAATMFSAHLVWLQSAAETSQISVNSKFIGLIEDLPIKHPLAFTLTLPLIIGFGAFAWMRENNYFRNLFLRWTKLYYRFVSSILHDILLKIGSFMAGSVVAWGIVVGGIVFVMMILIWVIFFWNPIVLPF